MKQLKFVAVLIAFCMLTGCSTIYPIGSVFTSVILPVAATSNSDKGTKTGTAECKSVFSMFATGDCSFEAAKKDGNITKVTHADWSAKNFLGIIGHYKLIVHGE